MRLPIGKMKRSELVELVNKFAEEAHQQNVKLVQVSRERDLLAAENAQMSTALGQLAASADKDGTPGWWRVAAMRWQMEATRLRDAIGYAITMGSWGGEQLKLLQRAIANVDAERRSVAPAAEGTKP